MQPESLWSPRTVICAAVLFLAGITAQAAIVQVVCREDGLSPENVTIYPGDTVEWVVESGAHIMTDGTPPDTGDLFSFVLLDGFPPQQIQFNEVRVIPYVDWHSGPPSAPNYFYGSITVQQPLLFPGPTGLNALYFEDDYDDGDVQLAVAMNNTWVAVYRQNIGQNTEGLVSVRSTDGGYSWSDTPVLISEYDFVDSVAEVAPAVAVNDLGVVVVAWASSYSLSGDFGTDLDIFTSRSFDGGLNWQPPVAVPTAPFDGTSTDTNPRLVWLQEVGDILLVWESDFNIYSTAGTDDDILFSKSTDGGASWGAPAVLTSSMNGDSLDDVAPALATDLSGRVVAAWVRENADDDILCAISTNDGTSFSIPYQVNTNQNSDTGDDNSVELAVDGEGNWVAAWLSTENLGGAIGTDSDLLYATSGTGNFWSSPGVLNSNAATDGTADRDLTLAVDPVSGLFLAAWYGFDRLLKDLGSEADILGVASRDGGQSWSRVFPINTNATSDVEPDEDPALALDKAGHILAAWTSASDYLNAGSDDDIFFSHTAHNFIAFGNLQAVNPFAETDSTTESEVDVLADGVSKTIMVWSGDDNGDGDDDIMAAISSSNGETWSPVYVNQAYTDSGEDIRPTLATDRAGTWICAWESTENLGGVIGTDEDILVSRLTPGATSWTVPIALRFTPEDEDAALDERPDAAWGNGRWVVTWATKNNQFGLGADKDIAFAWSDDGETWSYRVSGSYWYSDSADDLTPQVATDGAGTWTIAWCTSGNGKGASDTDLMFIRSEDDTVTWSEPALLNPDGASNVIPDANPSIATDDKGNWVAVWNFQWSEFNQDIKYSTSDDNGLSWSNSKLLTRRNEQDTTPGGSSLKSESTPRVATNGNGRWVVVWSSLTDFADQIGPSDYDILMAESQDDGLTWSQAGLVNGFGTIDEPNGSDNRDVRPVITSDRHGTWIVAWASEYDLAGEIGADYDILAAASTSQEVVDTGIHTADQDANNAISLSELLRVIQFFNSGGFHCAADPASTEDGYVPGPGADHTCGAHDCDYHPAGADWSISLSELLRLIQFFNSGGYHACPTEGTEDGYCPGAT